MIHIDVEPRDGECVLIKRFREDQARVMEFRAGQLCWFINGTISRGKVQRNWHDKLRICRGCPVYPMYVIGVVLVGTNGATYVYRVHASLDMVDVRGGFIKALVFSAIVSSACCFRGHFCHMRTDGYGAKSVGFATISAVVISCVTILISDYVLTSFLM
ncbi:MAG: ABC transporter permease [Syntrophorhabdales bacterium]